MNDLAMTPARTEMLAFVRDGIVIYDSGSGHWRVGDQVQTGWAGRTLSALRRNGYISVDTQAENPLYTVDLTDRGKEALTS